MVGHNEEFAACVYVAFVSFHLKVVPLELGSALESTGEFEANLGNIMGPSHYYSSIKVPSRPSI